MPANQPSNPRDSPLTKSLSEPSTSLPSKITDDLARDAQRRYHLPPAVRVGGAGLAWTTPAQVQVTNVEYLGSSVGTDTVVRMSPADGWAQVVAVVLVPRVPVDERLGDFAAVVEATEGVWDGEADDRDSDEEFSASDELQTGQGKLDMWTGCGQAHSPLSRQWFGNHAEKRDRPDFRGQEFEGNNATEKGDQVFGSSLAPPERNAERPSGEKDAPKK
jgi:hypothetical protein